MRDNDAARDNALGCISRFLGKVNFRMPRYNKIMTEVKENLQMRSAERRDQEKAEEFFFFSSPRAAILPAR